MEVWRVTARVARVLGLSLLILTCTSIAVYSAVAAYIEASLVNITNPPLNPPSRDGLVVLSLYSGFALTPLTGLVSRDVGARLEGLEGVYVWFEVTTPALANGKPVVVRGVDRVWAELYKPRVVQGTSFNEELPARAWVGVRLADELGVKPGDVVVVKPLFTSIEAPLLVAGILDVPQPYTYEVLVPLELGFKLRGSHDPSVVRVAYDPARVSESLIIQALRADSRVPPGAARVLSALVYGGYVRLEDPVRAQRYYVERLGVPYEVIVVAALIANVVVSLLNVVPAWLIYSLRGRSLAVLVEQGVSPRTLKLSLTLLTVPLVAISSIAGVLLAELLEPPRLLGYPIELELGGYLLIAHVAIQATLYTLGLVTGGIGES